MNATAETKSVPATESFEQIYRANVGAVTRFFARRRSEPQTVADLTSETFLRAVRSFSTFDQSRSSARAWLFGIARHVYANHCTQSDSERRAVIESGAHMALDEDEIDQLAARIDAQREGRRLLKQCALLPELDRVAIELVDLAGLSAKEAAVALDISHGALRVRLFRARARLRKGANDDDRL